MDGARIEPFEPADLVVYLQPGRNDAQLETDQRHGSKQRAIPIREISSQRTSKAVELVRVRLSAALTISSGAFHQFTRCSEESVVHRAHKAISHTTASSAAANNRVERPDRPRSGHSGPAQTLGSAAFLPDPGITTGHVNRRVQDRGYCHHSSTIRWQPASTRCAYNGFKENWSAEKRPSGSSFPLILRNRSYFSLLS